ncbi:MAG TPA: biopolymer transporter ExbD [Anaeromyxobacteraceae bacterium]|nr:biopolymer transporter ExbD [Anaeromyxobacteraceae bacterium]
MAGGGGVPEQGGSRGKKKKALDAVINVIPAIDLLSCCIAFLLFTAVWTQISRLQAQSPGAGGPPPTAAEMKQLQVTVALTEKGLTLTTSAGMSAEIPSAGKNPDGGPVYDLRALSTKLKQIKTEYPDQSSVTVAADDAVIYADLVKVIDACVGAGLSAVAVMATG